jgi:cold shock CspA family protein
VQPVVQATVATFDPDTGSGTVLTDDGRRIPFDPAAFAAGGLRLLRPGQRVRMDIVDGRIARITILTLA